MNKKEILKEIEKSFSKKELETFLKKELKRKKKEKYYKSKKRYCLVEFRLLKDGSVYIYIPALTYLPGSRYYYPYDICVYKKPSNTELLEEVKNILIHSKSAYKEGRYYKSRLFLKYYYNESLKIKNMMLVNSNPEFLKLYFMTKLKECYGEEVEVKT